MKSMLTRLAVIITLLAPVTVLAQHERGAWIGLARHVDPNVSSGISNELVQPPMLVWDGSFRLPSGTTAFGFCTCGLAYNALGSGGAGSLIVGTYNNNANWGGVSEVSIPALVKSGTLASLNRATTIQPDTDALEGKLFLARTGDGSAASDITGMLVKGTTLYINAASNYDANGNQPGSFFKRSVNLTSGGVVGPYTTTLARTGYTAGYLADIPTAYQATLGGDMVSGMWSKPIVGRESQGPSAFTFTASAIGATPVSTSTLIFYPPTIGGGLNRGFCGAGQGHPLCIETGDIQLDYNPAFSGGEGMVIPAGYRSALFFGGMGIGGFCYGQGTSNLALNGTPVGDGDFYCFDGEEPAKGNHAYYNPAGVSGYKPYYWFVDLNDMLAVKNGAVASNAIRPYAYGNLESVIPTYGALYGGKPGILGAAYDVANNRIFLSANYQDGDGPVIHVLHVVPSAPPPMCTETASGLRVASEVVSICDSTQHVWTLGSGTTPNIQVLRDGTQILSALGAQILYLSHVVYVQGDDLNWYNFNGTDFSFFGASDPEGGGTPTGYFVSTGGLDSNSCTAAQNILTPKRNLSGASGGISCLSAGSTLWVRQGSYDEGISSVPSGTSWTNKVRIAAYPGETVTLKPLSAATSAGGINMVVWLDGNYHYVEFDGINLDSTAISGGYVLWVSTNNFNDPHHIRFQNADISAGPSGGGAAVVLGSHQNFPGSGRAPQTGQNEILHSSVHGGGFTGFCGFPCANYGIYLQGPGNIIDGNDIYDNAGAGIHSYNASGDPANNQIIRNNRIHDIVRAGTLDEVWGILQVGSTSQIYNNVVWNIQIGNVNSGLGGISISGASNKVWHNVVYNVKNSGIAVDGASSATDVRNNIVYQVTGSAFSNSGSGGTNSGNMFSNVNPQFANVLAGNFRLASSSSPAYNAGIDLASAFAALVPPYAGFTFPYSDLEGIARSTPDIGAYEFH